MSNDDATHSTMSKDASDQAAVREAATIGDGSRALKDELLPGNANNPGSPDPAPQRNQTKAEGLDADQGIGAREPRLFNTEDATIDGEPDSDRLGGTDEQYRNEIDAADSSQSRVDPIVETRWEVPSADAPLDEDNASSGSPDRESFSSESDEDAGGA